MVLLSLCDAMIRIDDVILLFVQNVHFAFVGQRRQLFLFEETQFARCGVERMSKIRPIFRTLYQNWKRKQKNQNLNLKFSIVFEYHCAPNVAPCQLSLVRRLHCRRRTLLAADDIYGWWKWQLARVMLALRSESEMDVWDNGAVEIELQNWFERKKIKWHNIVYKNRKKKKLKNTH